MNDDTIADTCRTIDARGVVEVLDVDQYVAMTRYYDECDGKWKNGSDVMSCGTCGRSWDDAVVTGVTPTPSARCPFEYDHTDTSENTAALPPFSPDGTCIHDGAVLRFRESVYEYRNVNVKDDGAVTIVYTNEHSDGLGDETIECSSCLAEYAMPADFDWD